MKYPLRLALATTILLTNLFKFSHSLTQGVDVYEGIEQCVLNRAGPECDIPYETCQDGITRCFSNSRCTRGSKKNSLTNQIEYYHYCDCTYADASTNKVIRFAGVECEHSSTIECLGVKEGFGSQFCTNGGECMNYKHEGVLFGGCACPDEFAGAYCQYLSNSIKGGIAGENRIPDVHKNFWAFEPKKAHSSNAMSAAIGISVSAIGMITLAFCFALVKRKKLMKQHEERIAIDPTSIEPDGSGTLNNRVEVL